MALGGRTRLAFSIPAGSPEIITVGLLPKTAHFALNEAAKLLRAGVDLTKGRHRDLIGQVDCEFRPVDPKWAKHLMDWAVWYYDADDFPVLQAVYPDLENRFPEDEWFDSAFEQPLMQPTAPMTRAENDFWASADPTSSLFNWKFPDDPHARVFLSETVNKGPEPVTFVSHDATCAAMKAANSLSRVQDFWGSATVPGSQMCVPPQWLTDRPQQNRDSRIIQSVLPVEST